MCYLIGQSLLRRNSARSTSLTCHIKPLRTESSCCRVHCKSICHLLPVRGFSAKASSTTFCWQSSGEGTGQATATPTFLWSCCCVPVSCSGLHCSRQNLGS